MIWLRTHRDEILSLAALLSLALVFAGFGLVFWQLNRIENTLRVANIYQIQKDSRELVEKSLAVPGFNEFLVRTGPDAELDAEDRQRFEAQMDLLINFYLAVFQQDRMGGLSKRFSRSFAAEFCNFLKSASVQSYWNRKRAVGEFRGEHNRMRRSWCGAPQA